jgi:hypothetical protein
LKGVFDVASEWVLLRRGRVISSGVLDVFDVAGADPEMNGCGVAIEAEAAVRSDLV